MDPLTGKETAVLRGNTGYSALAFSADGRTLAATALDQTVLLWEVASAKVRRQLEGDQEGNFAVALARDGRLLATGGANRTIHLWDAATGKKLRSFEGHQGNVNTLALSADGKLLVSGSASPAANSQVKADATALVWDLAEVGKGLASKPVKRTAAELDALWGDLAGEDVEKAGAAVWALRASPEEAVKLIRDRVPKATAPDQGSRIDELIKQLDDDQFDVRENATKELIKLGKTAEKAVREVLAKPPSAEVKRRAEVILEKLKGGLAAAPDGLRLVRAVEVLEHLGTAEARTLLEALAKGSADAALTVEAKAALERLNAGK
jgi:hypothetical protein